MADFFFLSPHADDAVWSVGGLMHHLANTGHRVRLVTLFSAQALPLTDVGLAWAERSGAAPEELVRLRQTEDDLAAEALGVSRRDAGLVDAASRPWYRRGGPIGGPRAALDPLDDARGAVERFLRRQLEESAEPVLVSASGFGGHVDHQATAGAAAALEAELGVRLWFYEEFPYVIKRPLVEPRERLRGREPIEVPMSTESRRAHRAASCLYVTQVRAMWGGQAEFLADFDGASPAGQECRARVWVRGPQPELLGAP